MTVNKKPQIIAHRGGRKWAPENTLAAFKKSIAAGMDGVEFDVHKCASGELVVIHDDDLQRTTNGVGYIKDASYDEIKRLSAGRWFDESFKEERVPLLSEVLAVFNDKITVNIEIKNAPIGYPDIEYDLVSELENYPYKEKIVVSSFDHLFLRRFRALDKTTNIGILGAAQLIDIKEYAAKLNAKYYIQAFDCLLPEGAKEAQEAGLKVLAWTLNSTKDWDHAIEMGLDAIITDDPQGLENYLKLKT